MTRDLERSSSVGSAGRISPSYRGDFALRGASSSGNPPQSEKLPHDAGKGSPILITSRAAASGTRAGFRDHVRDRDHGRSPRSGQRRCSVITPASMITEDRPGQGGCRLTRDLGKSSSGGSAARLFPGFPETSRFAETSRPRHRAFPAPAPSLSGPGTEPFRPRHRAFPALARRLVAMRSLFRLWRGELSLRGALSAHRTVNTPCCDKSPR